MASVRMTDSNEIISRYTNNSAPDWANSYNETLVEASMKTLRDAGVLRDRTSILDVGCGYGSFLIRALQQYPFSQIIGVDLTQAMVTKANGYLLNPACSVLNNANLKRVRAYCGDLRDLSESSTSSIMTTIKNFTDSKSPKFDLIYSMSTFQHLTQAEMIPVIKNLQSLLKPNGYMFLGLRSGISEAFSVATMIYLGPGISDISPYRIWVPYKLGIEENGVTKIAWPLTAILATEGILNEIKSAVQSELAPLSSSTSLRLVSIWNSEELQHTSGNDYLRGHMFSQVKEAVELYKVKTHGKTDLDLINSLLDPSIRNPLVAKVKHNQEILEAAITEGIIDNIRAGIYKHGIKTPAPGERLSISTISWSVPYTYVLLRK
jgi:2-polyprenyl-3-methyl-5-hydroxy-6-metoxy-1,4-benzoquinol methylase